MDVYLIIILYILKKYKVVTKKYENMLKRNITYDNYHFNNIILDTFYELKNLQKFTIFFKNIKSKNK